MKNEASNSYKVDATGRPMGRLASDIAFHLRDKHLPSFTPNKLGTTTVEVDHVDQMRLTGNKLEQNVKYTHSGYPGGLQETTWKELFKTHPDQLLRNAVYGMLPKNRLRDEEMKRLIINEV